MKTMKNNNAARWAVFLVLALTVAGLLYLIGQLGLAQNPQSGRQLNWLGQVLMLIVGMATVVALSALQSLVSPMSALRGKAPKLKHIGKVSATEH